jgi:GGDEF domain-containing protein
VRNADLATLELQRRAYDHLIDRMTGLPKWALLIDRTMMGLARASRTDHHVAVMVLDEPRLGTRDRRADPGLVPVARALQARLRPDDTVARIGDRRLAVVCNEIRVDEDAAHIMRRILVDVGLSCRLGVALGQADDTAEQLIGRALLTATETVEAA